MTLEETRRLVRRKIHERSRLLARAARARAGWRNAKNAATARRNQAIEKEAMDALLRLPARYGDWA